MIISNSNNFVFIHLDKCGGTSVENALNPYLKNDDIKLGTLDFEPDHKELYYLEKYNLKKHSGAKDIKKHVGGKWESMYKFATVRNPKDIMISLYYYVKKNFNESIENDEYFDIYKKTIIDNSGIDGFIKNIIKCNYSSSYTITSRIDESVELFDIDFIDVHWSHILEKLNIKENVKLNKLNKSIKPKDIFLNNETLNLIRDHFDVDYKNIPLKTGSIWK